MYTRYVCRERLVRPNYLLTIASSKAKQINAKANRYGYRPEEGAELMRVSTYVREDISTYLLLFA